MQQFILIPEVPMIVRKIAPDGNRCAYWDGRYDAESACRECREWHRRLQEHIRPEESLLWSTKSPFTPSQTVLVTFKEQTDVR